MSQSAASQIVQQMEDELDLKLFDRSKRPFVLTPEGEVYYRGCRQLVDQFVALQEEVKTLHKEVEGRVTATSIYSIGLSHMSRLVQQFLSQHPKANVRLEYQHPHRVYESVEHDVVDLGLVSYPKGSRTIEAIAWREEPMVLACSPQHGLAQSPTVSVEQLHGQPLVGFDSHLIIRREIDKALAACGVESRVVMEFDNIETIKRAIEIDVGLGLLPAPTVEREVQLGSLKAIPLRGVDLVRPLGVIHRRGKQLGVTAQRFLQFLLESDLTRFSEQIPEQVSNEDSVQV